MTMQLRTGSRSYHNMSWFSIAVVHSSLPLTKLDYWPVFYPVLLSPVGSGVPRSSHPATSDWIWNLHGKHELHHQAKARRMETGCVFWQLKVQNALNRCCGRNNSKHNRKQQQWSIWDAFPLHWDKLHRKIRMCQVVCWTCPTKSCPMPTEFTVEMRSLVASVCWISLRD